MTGNIMPAHCRKQIFTISTFTPQLHVSGGNKKSQIVTIDDKELIGHDKTIRVYRCGGKIIKIEDLRGPAKKFILPKRTVLSTRS